MLAPVENYLREHHIPFEVKPHARAVTAQDLAAMLHVTGYQIAKPVVLDVDGQLWMAVVPAPLRVDERKVAEVLGAKTVRVASEEEFADRFLPCDVGAEPPLGHLFDLPAIVDERVVRNDALLFRAGSHEEAVQVPAAEFGRVEEPKIAAISRPPVQRLWGVHWESQEIDESSYGG